MNVVWWRPRHDNWRNLLLYNRHCRRVLAMVWSVYCAAYYYQRAHTDYLKQLLTLSVLEKRKVGAPVDEHLATSYATFFCNKVDSIGEYKKQLWMVRSRRSITEKCRCLDAFRRSRQVWYLKFFGLHHINNASQIQHRHGLWSRWVMS